jgi:hypothetical protein
MDDLVLHSLTMGLSIATGGVAMIQFGSLGGYEFFWGVVQW